MDVTLKTILKGYGDGLVKAGCRQGVLSADLMIVDDQGVFYNLLMPVNRSHQTGYGLNQFKYSIQKIKIFTDDMCEMYQINQSI